MDHFGIGTAIQGMARMYFQTSRRTGRTTSLIESVKDGDRIIFTDQREADRVKRICLEREVRIECIVINPETPQRIFDNGTSQGRTIFDHAWIEQYFTQAIKNAASDIDHFEKQLSGYGEAHRETKRKFEEMAKWGPWSEK